MITYILSVGLTVVIIAIVITLLVNKKFIDQLIVKFRGRTDEIMNGDASTPEGARDYYNVAIREKEELYTKASNSYAEISGKLDAAEKELYQLKKDLVRVVQNINRCIDDNNDNDALAFTKKKQTIESKIEVLKDTIAQLRQAKEQQREVRDSIRQQLDDLKEEKERVVYQLEADQQVIEMHASMDSANISNEGARMLERVREGAARTRERANGSRIAYENSPEATERRLEQDARDRDARAVLEEMKQKRKNQ